VADPTWDWREWEPVTLPDSWFPADWGLPTWCLLPPRTDTGEDTCDD